MSVLEEVAQQLTRIAEALERAHPKPKPPPKPVACGYCWQEREPAGWLRGEPICKDCADRWKASPEGRACMYFASPIGPVKTG